MRRIENSNGIQSFSPGLIAIAIYPGYGNCANRNPVGVALGLRGDQRDHSTLTGLGGRRAKRFLG
jgi:hypothetical protein